MTLTTTELRNHVDTILSNAGYLGVYQWNDGTTTKAIAVLPDDNYGLDYPPQEVTVNKIEAVIIKPQYQNKQLLGGDIHRKQRFQIFLKQWETRDGIGILVDPPRLREATQELYEELAHLLFDLTSPSYIPRNEKMGTIESSTFDVYCFDVCVPA